MKTSRSHIPKEDECFTRAQRADSKHQGHGAILRFPAMTDLPYEEATAKQWFQGLLLFYKIEKQVRYLQFLQGAHGSRDDRPSVSTIFGQLCNLLPLPGTSRHLVAIRQAKQKKFKGQQFNPFQRMYLSH